MARKSQVKRVDERKRQYAFLVYEDSSYPDWIERLDQMHVEGFVSPYHNKDKNPDGTRKKPHWHVLLMFEGKKSEAQINEIREKAIGPNYNKAFEDVGSLRGYARYLCHMDNPEKAQYDRLEVRALGGADYDAVIMLPSDDVRMLGDVMEYIRANNIRYFSDFLLICRDNNPDWFNMLVSRKSYVIIEFIKSETYKVQQMERDCYARGIDPATGEVLGMAELKERKQNESED